MWPQTTNQSGFPTAASPFNSGQPGFNAAPSQSFQSGFGQNNNTFTGNNMQPRPFGGGAPSSGFSAQPTGFGTQPAFNSNPGPSWNSGSNFGNHSNTFTNPNPGFSSGQGFMANNTFGVNPAPANPINPSPSFGVQTTNFSSGLFPGNPAPAFGNSAGFGVANPGFQSAANPFQGVTPSFGQPTGSFSNTAAPFGTNQPAFPTSQPSFTGNNFSAVSSSFSNPPVGNTGFGTTQSGLFGGNAGFGQTGGAVGATSFNSNFSNANQQIKFKPTQVKEDTITITVQNMCAMLECTDKSIEEIRFLDYKKRVPGQTPGLFNTGVSQPISNPIASAPSLFSNTLSLGLTQNNNNNLFNRPPENKPGSLFPTTTSAPSIYPTANFPASTGSLFQTTPTISNPTIGAQNITGPNLGAPSLSFPQQGGSLFQSSTNLFSSQSAPVQNPPSLFSNLQQPPISFTPAPQSQNSLFGPKPQNPGIPQQTQFTDLYKSAYKDPHGLSWLSELQLSEELNKSYSKRLSNQISGEPTSVVERIIKPKRLNNYPQVIADKWKNSQEKKYAKSSSSFDILCQKKSEPFFIAKRPSFVNLKLEEYKDEDNNRYFKVPGITARRPDNEFEIQVVAHAPNPIRIVLTVNPNTTVKDIKYQISRNLADFDDFQLVYKSKFLDENETVRSINLMKNEEITVIHSPVIKPENLDLPNDDMLPILAPGYTTIPSITEMARMSISSLKKVRNFTVKNEFGKLVFEGETDVIRLNVAGIIKIEQKSVGGYENEYVPKPDIGKELNKPAILTLYKFRTSLTEDVALQKIRNMCQEANMEFISYDHDSYELVVRIKHF
ncbi:hypothetical protein SteCoe_35507 [Stentor coeruleus]|uniref:Peptidase S59 domain-containing protein n=1 Tax=Stentor coeruleus TaxID=5963 RepID=A0A1R2AS84_9CILI|nr:hypothetical protein SteCoe_35507 [Stentor coeruleus]